MSINPVQPADSFLPQPGRFDSWDAGASSAQSAHDVAPDSGALAKTELRRAHDSTPSQEMPQDEVQVQREGEPNGEIVIKYLDRGGQVILQVPSSQVLGLARSIAHDLESGAEDHPEAGAPQVRAEQERPK